MHHNATIFINALMDAFNHDATTKTLQKNEFLLREGSVEKNLYWIESGALKVTYQSGNTEHIIRLGYKNTFINSLSSFFQQQPSEFHIIAIRKSNIKIIPQTTIVNLAQNNPQLLLAYNYLLQTLITQQMEREIDLLIDTPNERYQRVLTRSPQLFQEVPLKYIAAYLRMTPETLSRLRKS